MKSRPETRERIISSPIHLDRVFLSSRLREQERSVPNHTDAMIGVLYVVSTMYSRWYYLDHVCLSVCWIVGSWWSVTRGELRTSWFKTDDDERPSFGSIVSIDPTNIILHTSQCQKPSRLFFWYRGWWWGKFWVIIIFCEFVKIFPGDFHDETEFRIPSWVLTNIIYCAVSVLNSSVKKLP